MSSAWYAVVDSTAPLSQGDIIFDCPLACWQEAPARFEADEVSEVLKAATTAISADVIVMTQACDLEHQKVVNVILCAHTALEEFKSLWRQENETRGQNPTQKAWKSQCDDICDGFMWNLSMLNACTLAGMIMDIRIVDFHALFSAPRAFLESLLAHRNVPRFRLLPPYREHLSQAFARYFMRVGLPVPGWPLQNPPLVAGSKSPGDSGR